MRKVILWILVLVLMGTIFNLSNEPATTSRALSSGVTDRIVKGIAMIAPDSQMNWDLLHHLIRKMAHFLAYMGLGIFTALACRMFKQINGHYAIVAFLICVLFAISDEVHQLFIPGRSGEIRDVFIDSSGACLGILIVIGLRRLFRQRSIEK